MTSPRSATLRAKERPAIPLPITKNLIAFNDFEQSV
jgi:hypothetical protein